MKKKKGFTIVEVIIAIAVFAIATTSISIIINTSSNLFRQENVKFQTISAADSIIEQLRAAGTGTSTQGGSTKITSLQDFYSDTSTTDVYKYIYFNYDANAAGGSYDLHKFPLDYDKYHVATTASDCSSCNSYTGRPGGFNFGAWVHIKRTTPKLNDSGELNADWYYDTYIISVKVWKLSETNAENSEADEEASISR